MKKSTPTNCEAIQDFADDIFSLPKKSAKKSVKKISKPKINPDAPKAEISKQLSTDTKKFVKAGGKIEKVKPGKSGSIQHSPKGAGKKVKALTGGSKTGIRDRGDFVTLQSLLAEFKIAGVKARKALRTSSIKKPGKQWVWAKIETEALAEIRGFLKDLAK